MELHFSGHLLDGLKLIGFARWERNGGKRNVTLSARQYAVKGERRSFALLRPIVDASSQERVRDLILEAYAQYAAGEYCSQPPGRCRDAPAVLVRAVTTLEIVRERAVVALADLDANPASSARSRRHAHGTRSAVARPAALSDER